MDSVQRIWLRIESALERLAPAVAAALPAGASEEQLVAAEQQLGVALPADVLDFYRRHDGLPGVHVSGYGPVHSLGQLLKDALERAEDADEPMDEEEDGEIRRDIGWSARWIPLIPQGNGDVVCVDLDPPTPERLGQIIDWTHEGWTADYLAPSWREYLDAFAAELEEDDRYELFADGFHWNDGQPLLMPRG
ncbi:SMI1/KNR4 family protein [Kitasatospora kifunensis]|uniref:Cell wall assembly regulator SMI1 n=1 Tax=Kitasatospora kifunensis TaxID=58351 RepID=A0A7W7R1B6_KITKI|nr:SMI1/KNR4 family protein [Kitasatospora kifunensis]MBB4923587.1 cell wall assembly regulator SMI1 [Kitasatospora kifunensis]